MTRSLLPVIPGLALPAFAAAAALLTVSGFGFPDGHLTDWERAARPLCQGYAYACALLAVGTAGAVATGRTRLAWALGGLFLVGSLGLAGYMEVALGGLEHGQGG